MNNTSTLSINVIIQVAWVLCMGVDNLLVRPFQADLHQQFPWLLGSFLIQRKGSESYLSCLVMLIRLISLSYCFILEFGNYRNFSYHNINDLTLFMVTKWLNYVHDLFSIQEMSLKEDHPLALNLSFTPSLGFLPVMFSLKTAGCGIKNSGLPDEQGGDVDDNSKYLYM